MRSKDFQRIQKYVIQYGYSAERVAELFNWGIDVVREIKCGSPEMSRLSEENLKRGVAMVLSGKSVEEAARAVKATVPQMLSAVHNAKTEINRLVKAAR